MVGFFWSLPEAKNLNERQISTFLANSLRLPTCLEKEGRVIFQDDFERATNLQWEAYATDAGGTAALDNTDRRVFRGEKACKITTGTTSGYRADIRRRFGVPESGKMSMNFWFSSPDANAQYIEFGAYTFDGALTKIFAVRYHFVNKKWYYYDSSGSFSEITGMPQDLTSQEIDLNHFTSFRFDITKRKLLGLKCDDMDVDLSNYVPWQTTSTTLPYVRFYIRLATNAAAASSMWIDDVVIAELD